MPKFSSLSTIVIDFIWSAMAKFVLPPTFSLLVLERLAQTLRNEQSWNILWPK